MDIVGIIEKKRDKKELTDEEIRFFIKSVCNGAAADYQISALLMAIYLNKMTDRETAVLTDAMAHSGDIMDLSFAQGIKIDKHSSGGVGDKTTLVVAPLVAACGLKVAKMSGRGLGFSGGTIDKLESIRGFQTSLPEEKFRELVNKNGLCVISQTKDVATADKKLYALRDVTGTVPDMSLIASSIMSKKLACNSDGIVLDVKVGSGAFVKTVEEAVELAQKMVAIGTANGKKTVAAITDMDQPLGFAVGNALEVEEAVKTLKGEGPEDFTELCMIIAGFMLVLGEKATDFAEARGLLADAIKSGRAFEKFADFVRDQQGDVSVINNTELLPKAKLVESVKAQHDGFIGSIMTENIGRAAIILGAGRLKKEDSINFATGVVFRKKVGDSVKKDDVICEIHADDEKSAQSAKELILSSVSISKSAEKRKMLIAYVDKDGVHYE